MKNIVHQTTKKLIKKVNNLKKELKKNTPIEKFVVPDAVHNKKTKEPVQVVEISSKSVAKGTLTIISILLMTYFLYSIKSLLGVFFVSLFFAAALDPVVDWLEKKHIPRTVGVLFVFFCLFGIIVAILGSMLPIIINQILSLVSQLTDAMLNIFYNLQQGELLDFLPKTIHEWLLNTLHSMNFETIIEQILKNLSGLAQQVQNIASGSLKTLGTTVEAGVSVTVSIASGLFNLILVLFLTFFMIVDKGNLNDFFHSLFPKKYGVYISAKTKAIQAQIGAWVGGQVLLSCIMFLTTFIGLLIIGMSKYALTLALIMAVGEFIPYIGPLIFLSFALPIAFGTSITVVLKLIIFYSILQFVEGNIFVPSVMKKAVGLSPIVVLLVLIIGFQFFGVIGAIIAVPVTTAIAIFIKDYTQSVAKK